MKKILLAFTLSLLAVTSAMAEQDQLKVTTLDGQTISVTGTTKGIVFDKYKGKIVFLEFFGHNCPPCIASIPHYIDLKNKYKDDLAILAIEVQNMQKNDLENFVKRYKINYDVASMQDGTNLVTYVMQRAQWKGSIPFLMIIDQEGAVQLMQAGMLPEKTLESMINQLQKRKLSEGVAKDSNKTKKESNTTKDANKSNS